MDEIKEELKAYQALLRYLLASDEDPETWAAMASSSIEQFLNEPQRLKIED